MQQPLFWETKAFVCKEKKDSKALVEAYQNWLLYKHENQDERPLLEMVSWGVFEKGVDSCFVPTRLLAIIAAGMSNDHRGAEFIQKALTDSNGLVRAFAAVSARSYPDRYLQQAVIQAWQKERDWRVRMEMLRTIGMQRNQEMLPLLLRLLENRSLPTQERALAAEAVVHITDAISKESVQELAVSNAKGLRLLAAEVIAYLKEENMWQDLIMLMDDSAKQVCLSACRAVLHFPVSYRKDPEYMRILDHLLDSKDADVALMAALLADSKEEPRVEEIFTRYLNSSDRSLKTQALVTLGRSGTLGLPYLKRTLLDTKDVVVRANAAVSLLKARQSLSPDEQVACQEALQDLIAHPVRLVRQQEGFLEQRWVHRKGALFDAVAVDQATRLDLVALLQLLSPSSAEKSLSHFLANFTWRNSGSLFAILLQECDQGAIETVRKQMQQGKTAQIRLAAALILAMWEKDAEIVDVLLSCYDTSTREEKERILQGLGLIGHERALNFLVQRFSESSESLRTLAAFAVLQILYH